MKDEIYVFGHTNPDCDSICSSITYAELKNKLGHGHYVPCRLGNLSAEAKFALKRFNFESPKLIVDVRPQIEDLSSFERIYIYEDNSIQKAINKMHKNNISLLPVVDRKKKLTGIITFFGIAKKYDKLSEETSVKTYTAPFENMLYALEGEVISGQYPSDVIKGSIHLDFELEKGQKLSKQDIVIVGKLKVLRNRAIKSGAGCIICTGDSEIPEVEGSVVVKVKHSFFKTIKMINRCISVDNIMKKKNYVFFSINDYIDEVEPIIKGSPQRFFPIVDKEGLIMGILSSKDLLNLNRKKVVLVDHNEASQSARGIETAKIEEVVDHHKIAEFQTHEPITFFTLPVGSTATIIARKFEVSNVEITPDIAGLLLSAIISDTLLFKSPTGTPEDKEVALKLADIANVDIEEYGMELLGAGTSLEGKNPEDIFHSDMKVYTVGYSRIAVGQVNSVDNLKVLEQKEALIKVMADYNKEKDCQTSVLMITNIIKSVTDMLVVGEKDLVVKAFGVEIIDDVMELVGIVSRKKQIMPKIMKAV